MKRTAYATVLLLVTIQDVLPLVGFLLMYLMYYLGVPPGDLHNVLLRFQAAGPMLLFGPAAIPFQLAVIVLLGRRLWLSVKARHFAIPAPLRSFAYGVALVVTASALLTVVALGLTLVLCQAGACSGIPAGIVFLLAYVLAPFVFLYCEIRSIFERSVGMSPK